MLRQEITSFSFYLDWFTRNYKDRINSQPLCTNSSENVFFKEEMARGRNCLGVCIETCINFGRFTNQFKYQASSDSKQMKMLHGLMGYQKKRTVQAKTHPYSVCTNFNSICTCIWGKRIRNLRLCGHYLEHCLMTFP